jgi:hypothetical protein
VSPLNKQIPCFLFKSLIKLLPYEKMTKEPIMNPLDLFNQVKEMIEKKDFDAAKKFVEDNKDKLGEYLDQAKKLVAGNEMASDAIDKIKGLF